MYYHNSNDNSNNSVNKDFHHQNTSLNSSTPMHPLLSQSFIPVSPHQSQGDTMDSSYSYLSNTNNYPSHPDQSFYLDESPMLRSALATEHSAQEWDDLYENNGTHDNQHYFMPITNANQQQDTVEKIDYYDQPFLVEQQEQAILFSDPTFLRQQQLLQEQQRTMQMRMDKEDSEKKNGVEPTHSSRSNLSAMFDHPSPTDPPQSLPDHSQGSSLSAMESVPQGQSEDAKNSAWPVKSQLKKDTPRKSQNSGTLNTRIHRANPIPIGNPSTNDGTRASSVASEIDHQRRFNELQARFRVNYARKPVQRSRGAGSQTSIIVSSSFTDPPSNFRQVSHSHATPGYTLGTSMPATLSQGLPQDTPFHSSADTPQTPTERRRSLDQPIPFGLCRRDTHPCHATSFPSRTMPIQIQRIQRGGMSQPFDAEQHQRRLDDQLERANFDDITVSELKDMLRQRGKPATGKKAILLQRLQEERDYIQAVRGGRAQRFSQPSSASRRLNESSRPRSFQGTSPLMSVNVPSSPLFNSPSSVPDTSFLPGSPGSSFSLHRSIANMHIGSPPPNRRFSPYAAPSSPRLASPSPKLQPQLSVSPLPETLSSPVSPSINVFPTVGSTPTISSRRRAYPSGGNSMTLNSPGFALNNRRRSYAPFTSSTLATPDREHTNPFDNLPLADDTLAMDGDRAFGRGEEMKHETMEWMSPSLENLLQQAYLQTGNTMELSLLQGASQEDILAFLSEQDINYNTPVGIPMNSMKLHESENHGDNGFGFGSYNTTGQSSYHPRGGEW
ncbi:hypothetical protein BDF14DRAFT_1886114 [Spinellus fusiger]|nr:hypothetical protein BDF14DRAFT_1886114 [Spinellus fusiger]